MAVDGYITQDQKTGRWKLSSPPPESMRDAVLNALDERNSAKSKPAENVQKPRTDDGKISLEFETADGKKGNMRVDPEQHIKDIDSRMDAVRAFIECMRK